MVLSSRTLFWFFFFFFWSISLCDSGQGSNTILNRLAEVGLHILLAYLWLNKRYIGLKCFDVNVANSLLSQDEIICKMDDWFAITCIVNEMKMFVWLGHYGKKGWGVWGMCILFIWAWPYSPLLCVWGVIHPGSEGYHEWRNHLQLEATPCAITSYVDYSGSNLVQQLVVVSYCI